MNLSISKELPPVITIDGLSGTGKGTICGLLARRLNWHQLDSGVLYRALAWGILHRNMTVHMIAEASDLLELFHIRLQYTVPGALVEVFCNDQNITEAIRLEACGHMASEIAVLPNVREALLVLQQNARQFPGLVADGRDMGTVVFPDAMVKFFFTADSTVRVERRYRQLKKKGFVVDHDEIEEEMYLRDERDSHRSIAPAKPAPDAVVIDTTDLEVEMVLERVMGFVQEFV